MTATTPAIFAPGTTFRYRDKLNWFGTVRGRVGVALDRWLPYVTAGWAYGHGSISGNSTTPASYSGSKNYSGWTAGGGLEWAFQNNWSAKAEFLYIDFGNGPSVTFPGANIIGGKMTDNIGRLGINYRF